MAAITARERRDSDDTDQPTGLMALHQKIADKVKRRR